MMLNELGKAKHRKEKGKKKKRVILPDTAATQ